MRDILPRTAQRFEHIRRTVKGILELSGYRRIQTPVIEHKELYASKLQSVSEVFGMEMYGFYDRLSDKHLVLRPENTASIARAVADHSLLHNDPVRLWYDEPMFRRERHQKGRYRQFYQIGVEALGFGDIGIEAELLMLCRKILIALGLKGVELQLNTLGSQVDRPSYEDCLLRYLSAHSQCFCSHPKVSIVRPLKVLDTKMTPQKEIVKCAPNIYGYLSYNSLWRFSALLKTLEEQGVTFNVAPSLVRGIDYYDHTVFEWQLERSNRTLVAGGRYDGLMKLFGNDPKGCGWALGLDRLEEVSTTSSVSYVDVVILYTNLFEWRVAQSIRRELETFNLVVTLRPKRNLGRTRGKILRLGGNYLVYMLPTRIDDIDIRTDPCTTLSRLEDIVSYVLSDMKLP